MAPDADTTETRTDARARPAARSPSASYWPGEMVNAFSLGMAGFGLSVSGILMRIDPAYALRQISLACELPDAGLRELAMSMFRLFEQARSGVPHVA